MTGAPRGELCALRWTDVDLVAGSLTIATPARSGRPRPRRVCRTTPSSSARRSTAPGHGGPTASPLPSSGSGRPQTSQRSRSTACGTSRRRGCSPPASRCGPLPGGSATPTRRRPSTSMVTGSRHRTRRLPPCLAISSATGPTAFTPRPSQVGATGHEGPRLAEGVAERTALGDWVTALPTTKVSPTPMGIRGCR